MKTTSIINLRQVLQLFWNFLERVKFTLEIKIHNVLRRSITRKKNQCLTWTHPWIKNPCRLMLDWSINIVEKRPPSSNQGGKSLLYLSTPRRDANSLVHNVHRVWGQASDCGTKISTGHRNGSATCTYAISVLLETHNSEMVMWGECFQKKETLEKDETNNSIYWSWYIKSISSVRFLYPLHKCSVRLHEKIIKAHEKNFR